jgi:hypothetical protein
MMSTLLKPQTTKVNHKGPVPALAGGVAHRLLGTDHRLEPVTPVEMSSQRVIVHWASFLNQSDNSLLSFQETQYGQQFWNSYTRTMNGQFLSVCRKVLVSFLIIGFLNGQWPLYNCSRNSDRRPCVPKCASPKVQTAGRWWHYVYGWSMWAETKKHSSFRGEYIVCYNPTISWATRIIRSIILFNTIYSAPVWVLVCVVCTYTECTLAEFLSPPSLSPPSLSLQVLLRAPKCPIPKVSRWDCEFFSISVLVYAPHKGI